jgi:hypothetical protein
MTTTTAKKLLNTIERYAADRPWSPDLCNHRLLMPLLIPAREMGGIRRSEVRRVLLAALEAIEDADAAGQR